MTTSTLQFELRREQALPLHRQLYQRIRDAILAGQLPPGTRLPATRVLAADLAVSRGTVDQAYGQLLAEGFLLSRAAAGTVVHPQLEARRVGQLARHVVPDASPPAQTEPRELLQPLPFQLGLPALDAFPRKLWARLAGQRARSLSLAGLSYPAPAGYLPLREAIAHHLALFRGIDCRTEQVFITNGFQGALSIVTQTLLNTGDPVWMEDPGYFRASGALRLAGARLVPVPVDQDGLQMDEAIRRCPEARLVYCTPSHHAPLGVTLSLPRRLELLDWAQQQGAWVIEDDYDGEFRYDGPPLPALQSLDTASRVLYIGSFSKTLFPGLRLGYLVVPASEAARFAEAADLFSPAPSILDQATTADFLRQGHFARHIKRMRALYAERRAALAAALEAECGTRLQLDGHAVGLQLIGWLAEGEDDRAVAARLTARGLAGQPLSHFSPQGGHPPALLFGFANVPVEQAPALARRVREALDGQ
ncbi:PLP-dependent aminotransferase family protein [Crenobacter sp. SG2303]|uniref:Putative 8-amino-7-oxononanoate synthase n=1 Tax=Crenobacter oryzisoli TaxID=3056844 RepID=A0ABT7XSZ4_9NEIS|nr:PLP-dependent aminotransferase family protein [Crenobacter sp. SG2303]MDN0076920.1 PLP-dependent aminotransferase family protein [Crenobacter sp. SG2303]